MPSKLQFEKSDFIDHSVVQLMLNFVYPIFMRIFLLPIYVYNPIKYGVGFGKLVSL